MPTRKNAFTLVEIIVVIAIILILAGLAFPIMSRAKAASKQSACLANLRQLAVGLAIYAADNDDKHPVAKIPKTLFKTQPEASLGWAGRIYPYVKASGSFQCPTDATQPQPKDHTGAVPEPVSYALNLNVSVTPNMSQMSAPAKTVWLFEVAGNLARVSLSDEGASQLTLESDQMSAIGDGTQGGILSNVAAWTGTGQGVFTTYATGHMDNWQVLHIPVSDTYEDIPGRHNEGANYLAADGHATFQQGSRISAGGNAADSSSKQTDQGCNFIWSKYNAWPCAEGTGLGGHILTFSLR